MYLHTYIHTYRYILQITDETEWLYTWLWLPHRDNKYLNYIPRMVSENTVQVSFSRWYQH